jgi:hypothetical protein
VGISCEEVWRDLSDYVDDELTAGQKALLDAHLAECRRCSAVLVGTRNIIGIYRDERLLAMPEVYRERLQESLRARTAPPRRTFLKWGLAAAAAVPLGFGFYSLVSYEKGKHFPSQFDGLPADSLVAVSQDDSIKVFHLTGCPKLLGTPKFLRDREAVHDGYLPCPYCVGKLQQQKQG